MVVEGGAGVDAEPAAPRDAAAGTAASGETGSTDDTGAALGAADEDAETAFSADGDCPPPGWEEDFIGDDADDVAELHDAPDCNIAVQADGCDAHDEVTEPARKRRRGEPHPSVAAHYIKNQYEPMYPGAPPGVTGLAHTFLWMHMKQAHTVENLVFDMMCRIHHDWLLPQPNFCPPSYYMMKRIVNVDAADRYEFHFCPTCCTRYEPLARTDWGANADAKCGHCGDARFVQLQSARLMPAGRGWDLGVELVNQSFWNNAAVAADVGRQRDSEFNDPATFFGSDYGHLLDKLCGNIFSEAQAPPGHGAPVIMRDGHPVHAAVYSLGTYRV